MDEVSITETRKEQKAMKSKRKKPLQNVNLEKLILAKVLLELIKSIVELINKLIE